MLFSWLSQSAVFVTTVGVPTAVGIVWSIHSQLIALNSELKLLATQNAAVVADLKAVTEQLNDIDKRLTVVEYKQKHLGPK